MDWYVSIISRVAGADSQTWQMSTVTGAHSLVDAEQMFHECHPYQYQYQCQTRRRGPLFDWMVT